MVDGVIWAVKRGEDATLELEGVDTTDPSGWTLLFTLTAYAGASTAVLTAVPTVSGPDADGIYTIVVRLTRAQTLALLTPLTDGYSKTYAFDVWRTDTGDQIPLTSGSVVVSAPSRLAA